MAESEQERSTQFLIIRGLIIGLVVVGLVVGLVFLIWGLIKSESSEITDARSKISSRPSGVPMLMSEMSPEKVVKMIVAYNLLKSLSGNLVYDKMRGRYVGTDLYRNPGKSTYDKEKNVYLETDPGRQDTDLLRGREDIHLYLNESDPNNKWATLWVPLDFDLYINMSTTRNASL